MSSTVVGPGAESDRAQDAYGFAAFRLQAGAAALHVIVPSFCLAFSMIMMAGTLAGLYQPVLLRVETVATLFCIAALAGVMSVLLAFMHVAPRITVTGYACQRASRVTSPCYDRIVAFLGITSFEEDTSVEVEPKHG